MPFRAIVRFGSTTKTDAIYKEQVKLGRTIVEINTVAAVENSRSKLKMKECFKNGNIPQSDWYVYTRTEAGVAMFSVNGGDRILTANELSYPILAKRVYGFKAHGMQMLSSAVELRKFLNTSGTLQYYYERYYNYNREYRLHCTEEGCFYAVRKMLKADTPDNERWFRNDSNCVWITEHQVVKNSDGTIIKYNEDVDNPNFDKPANWASIEKACVDALDEVGLHIGAFDVRVQAATSGGRKREYPNFIVIEVNSAPSFGDITLMKYEEVLPRILHHEFSKLTV